MADYYDIFVRNAFGNYYDVLREVTLHPVMGRYLSHIGNQKARPEINQYPDENYARSAATVHHRFVGIESRRHQPT